MPAMPMGITTTFSEANGVLIGLDIGIIRHKTLNLINN